MNKNELEETLINHLKNNDFSHINSILKKMGISKEESEILENNNFALLLGVIADQSVRSNIAWSLPYKLQKRLKIDLLSPENILENEPHILAALKEKPALHRFPNKMSEYFIALSKIIINKYDGDTDKFLLPSLKLKDILPNLIQVPGISWKKAGLLCLILELDRQLPIQDKSESYALMDSHVENFLRLQLHSPQKISGKEATEIFKKVYPNNPALVSTIIWDIDRKK